MAVPQLAPPTKEQFTAYERMFVHFNRALFANQLPTVLLNFSRAAKTNGFFAPERWERGKTVKHEISLNPSTLKLRRPIEVASTTRARDGAPLAAHQRFTEPQRVSQP